VAGVGLTRGGIGAGLPERSGETSEESEQMIRHLHGKGGVKGGTILDGKGTWGEKCGVSVHRGPLWGAGTRVRAIIGWGETQAR